MATFHIHEDKENYQQQAFHQTKNFYNGVQQKKINNNNKNRVTFQSLSNGIKHDAKRPKLAEKCYESVIEIVKLKSQERELKDNHEDSSIETSFCEVKKEIKELPTTKGNENDQFPLALLHNDEYRKDIWQYLTKIESEGPRPKYNYMLKQADLSWNTRSILVDWLGSVADEYKFCEQTFHLSVNYVDRFLSQISVARNKFQLLGAAAMMIAGKMEEYQAIDAQEWSYLTGDTFTPRQVLKMEQLILKVLRFRMQPPTTYTYIQHLSAEHKMDAKIIHLAMYICELMLLEGDEYLEHFPSKQASAALVLARHTLSKQKPWPKKLRKASGYTLKELSPVVQKQHKTLRDSPLKQQQAIQSKYKSEKYYKVALLRPRALLLDDFDVDEE